MKSSTKQPKDETTSAVMYGDLMNGLCFTAFLPVYVFLWRTRFAEEVGPRNICIAFFWTTVFSWISYLKVSSVASALALISMEFAIAGMNIYEWPHVGEVIIEPQFVWSLLIITINQPLNSYYKAGLALVALLNALNVVRVMNVPSKLPLLLGALAVYGVFHYRALYGRQRLISAHTASLVLAGSFCYYASFEMMSMYNSPSTYTTQGGYNILRIGFFAAAGLAASGSFRQEIEFKQALELLVEQRAAELKTQAEQLRIVEHALQASETAVAITDSQHVILWSNKAVLHLLAYSGIGSQGEHGEPSSLQDSCLLDALNLETDDREELQRCFADPSFQRTLSKDIVIHGRYIEAEVSPFPGQDSNSKDAKRDLPRYLVVLKDITERRAREKAEKAAEREALLSRAMVESMQTLSHELRTPLQGIMGMTSLIIGDPTLSKETADSLSVVMTSSRLLLTLINNMLDTRKCEAGRMDDFQLQPLDLSVSLTEATDFCRPFASISDVHLKLEPLQDDMLSIQSNGLRFQQVMINLISNSIKYSPTGSIVSVSARVMSLASAESELVGKALAVGKTIGNTTASQTGDGCSVVVISVADQGRGIDPSQRDKIFGRFAQLNSKQVQSIGGSKAVGQPSGTGLGLNLCVQFVDRMNGKIWVGHNESGRGASFSFYLPVAVKPTPELVREGAKSRQLRVASPPPLRTRRGVIKSAVATKNRILVVDDTLINLKVLRRQLESLGCQNVCTVNCPYRALEELKEHDAFDLVITDLQMPGMTGVQLTEVIRSKMGPDLLVVGLTADSSEATDDMCRRSGMQHVLHKPIAQEGLYDFFENILPEL